MGCDIHILCEIKYPGEPWKLWLKRPYISYDSYKDPYNYANDEIDCISGRNYEFFGILAGVRSMFHKPIADGRGVPKDATKETLEWLDENEYHSITWCNIREMERAIKKYEHTMWESALDDFDAAANLFRRIDKLEKIRSKNKSPIYIPETGRDHYFDYDTLTVEPVKDAYEAIKAECEFLGQGKPRMRFVIGFDS